jgi:type I restriction enzyme S subunit
MKVNDLLKHYDRVADSDDAVARMRELVIDLAVRGKLVEQDPNEAQVTQLVRRITQAQAEQGEKTSKRTSSGWLLDDGEHPFDIPSGWRFVRLGGVLDMINGRAFKPTDWIPRGLPIVRIQNLNNVAAPFNYCDLDSVAQRHRIDDGEFLISWSGTPGTSFGAFIWQRGPAALNQHIFRCVQIGDAFVPSFLRLAINSQLHVLIEKAQGGVGLQHVTKGTLEALPLPLPSMEEQHRVVAKVEELMALCDQLEKARAERETRRDKLTAATLARLNTPNPETFRNEASLALQNFTSLTTRADQIQQLRKTILNLAVRGLLVKQDENDNGSKLLERILERRRQQRTSATLPAPDEPYPIPTQWRWTTLDAVVIAGPQNGVSPKPTQREDAPRALTLTATTSGKLKLDHFKHVDIKVAEDSDLWLQEGDLLFQRGNTREYVGIAAIFDGPPRKFLFPDLMIRVRISDLVDLRFVHMVAVAPPSRAYFSTSASGAQKTMPKINQTTLLSLPMPLPPLSEQRRIVAKVDELMSVCDALELAIASGNGLRSQLLDTLLSEALRPPSEPTSSGRARSDDSPIARQIRRAS